MDQDVYDNLRLGCDVGSTQELFGFHNTERAPQLQIGRKSLSLVETVGPYQIDT